MGKQIFGGSILRFEEAVEMANDSVKDIELLPVCHNTFEGSFEQIQLDGSITPADDKIYNEKLSYFFYGMPNYISAHVKLDELTADLPITLIFELSSIKNRIHRILPFDSGGFSRLNFKRGYIKEHFTVNNPTHDKIKKLIKLLFSNNQNYMKKKPQISVKDKKIIKECRPLQLLINLIKTANTVGGAFGYQAFTIELQFKDVKVKLTPKYLLTHYSYFSSDNWASKIEDYSKEGIILDYYGNARSGTMLLREAYAEIGKKVKNYVFKTNIRADAKKKTKIIKKRS